MSSSCIWTFNIGKNKIRKLTLGGGGLGERRNWENGLTKIVSLQYLSPTKMPTREDAKR